VNRLLARLVPIAALAALAAVALVFIGCDESSDSLEPGVWIALSADRGAFADDVPASVAGVFALHPTSFGAIGDSTGAMCAVKLAVMDPQRFNAAVSLSGYFHAITDFTTGDLYGGSTTTRNMNDIMWRLQHLPLPAVSLLVATSLTEKGADGHGAAQRLLALVRAPMSADELVLSRGGHNFETWTREIPSALRWFGWHLTA